MDFQNINFGIGFDPIHDYPLGFHSLPRNCMFKGIAIPPCTASIIPPLHDGGVSVLVFKSHSCNHTINRTTGPTLKAPVSRHEVCSSCYSLLHNSALKASLVRSASKDYGIKIADIFCPRFEIVRCKSSLRRERDKLRLQTFNDQRKIASNRKRLGDSQRLLVAMSQADSPYLSRLLASHLRNNKSLPKFHEKIDRACSFVERGNNVFRRVMVPRYTKKQLEDDSTSEQFFRAIDKSFLYLKLGSKRAL